MCIKRWQISNDHLVVKRVACDFLSVGGKSRLSPVQTNVRPRGGGREGSMGVGRSVCTGRGRGNKGRSRFIGPFWSQGEVGEKCRGRNEE